MQATLEALARRTSKQPAELTDDARYRKISLFTHQRNRSDPLTNWLFQECAELLKQY